MPTINRSRMSMAAFGENADNTALIRAPVDVSRMTFSRPNEGLSDINPQKCELITMPKNAEEATKPNSVVVIFKSQFAYGSAKAMLIFSTVAPIKTVPDIRIISKLNRPVPLAEIQKHVKIKTNNISTRLISNWIIYLINKGLHQLCTFSFHCSRCSVFLYLVLN